MTINANETALTILRDELKNPEKASEILTSILKVRENAIEERMYIVLSAKYRAQRRAGKDFYAALDAEAAERERLREEAEKKASFADSENEKQEARRGMLHRVLFPFRLVGKGFSVLFSLLLKKANG